MKRLLLAILALGAAVTWARAEDEGFSRTLTPEEFKAAGLDRLSPEELRRLDELVRQRKAEADTAGTRRTTEEERLKKLAADAEARAAKAEAEAKAARDQAEARAAKAEADSKAARAEAEARLAKAEAETRAAKEEAAAGGDKTKRSFLSKAKVLLVPGTKIEYAVVKATIAHFEGWSGRTSWLLSNGQRWEVANAGERYFTRPRDNVEVEISPAALGGYWMWIPDYKVQVRVKLVDSN